MNSGSHPHFACAHDQGMIQLERLDGRASARREANDLGSVNRPSKVIAPPVATRVKEYNRVVGHRIDRHTPIGFEGIAATARDPKVFPNGCTTGRLGNEVFDLVSDPQPFFTATAITASVTGVRSDLTPQFR